MNRQFANEKVMRDYLSALLHDEPVVENTEPQTQQLEPELKPVEALLEQVTLQTEEALLESVAPQVEETEAKVQVIEPDSRVEQQVEQNLVEPVAPAKEKLPWVAEAPFQALFFKVAGLTMAVPLTELGGIHKVDKLNKIFGKPDWFMGLMNNRDAQYQAVDSARWVMPEKYNESLKESLNYQYLILLGQSRWGLACESLINTVTLSPEDVKWRTQAGKRPWLAGLVKEHMCALVDVDAMISILDAGLDTAELNLNQGA